MKKTRWMVIGALLIAGMVQADVVTLDENSPTKVANWYAIDNTNPADGIANSGSGGNTNVLSFNVGQAAGNKLLRGALYFDVAGQDAITNAVLTVRLTGRAGGGTFGANPTYDLSLYAAAKSSLGVSTPAQTSVAMMYDADFVDTGLDLPKTSTSGWYSFDVTASVNAAATNGGVAAFRFQMDNDTSLAYGVNDYYTVAAFKDAAGNAPELVLSTIPEPATIGMLGIGAMITLLVRNKCTL
jgi:hypothetical protein